MPSKSEIAATSLLAAALATLLLATLGAPRTAGAGCLAPRDIVVDVDGTAGPFWGNDRGDLLYTQILFRNLSNEHFALRLRLGAGGSELLAEEHGSTGAFLGTETERYVAFHGGATNDAGDVVFVASTAADDDDANTPENETIARRGLFYRRGGTRQRIARFGEPSPVLDGMSNAIPWASIFDATPSDRNPTFAQVIFSAQLDQPDGRTGLFVWDEASQVVTPLVLEGDVGPEGGVFSAFGRTRINGGGDAAFFALEQIGAGLPEAGLYLREKGGAVVRVAEFGAGGEAAPTGERLSLLKDFDVDDAGVVTFVSVLADGSHPAGVFRRSPAGALESLMLEGDDSLLGGRYLDVSRAQVRATGGGQAVVGVPLTDDIGGDGVFLFEQGALSPIPLASTDTLISVAALGQGGAAYQVVDATHTVVPASGLEEGPTDFRVSKVDLKNNIRLGTDALRFDGRITLPPFPAQPSDPGPASFRTSGVSVLAPDREFTGDDLLRVARVTVKVSDHPGNAYVFGLSDGGASPSGTYSYNGAAGPAPKVKLGRSGRSAAWNFKGDNGRGRFTLDLETGLFSLRVAKANLRESFFATDFLVELTLQSEDDVGAGRTGDQAWFHRSVVLDGDQPNFGQGLRVRSKGERVTGGTVFVDGLTVKRKLKVKKGVAAPDVTSDAVVLDGTLRLCPGSTPPTTPTLAGHFQVGDADFDGISLARIGRTGAKYRFKSAKGAVPALDLFVDVVGGRFRAKVKNAPPLSQLVDADFSGGTPTNGPQDTVGGMTLPIVLDVARVYAVSLDVPMTRQRGGKIFSR